MPFAPVSNPDLAAQLMFQGISQAGQGLAGGLSTALQQIQQKSKDRKSALGMLDSMHAAGNLDDATFEGLKNADTHTIEGTLHGMITANVLKSEAGKIALQTLQFKNLQTSTQQDADFNKKLLDATTSAPAVRDDAPNLAYENVDPQKTQEINSQNVMKAALAAGAMTHPGVIQLSEHLAQNDERLNASKLRTAAMAHENANRFPIGDLGTIKPTAYPGIGFVPTTVSGGQIIADPSAGLQTETILDANGQPQVVFKNTRTGAAQQLRTDAAAPQQNADTRTLIDASEGVTKARQNINAWNYQAAQNKADPKKNPAPNPEDLATYRQHLTQFESIFNTASGRLQGTSTPGNASQAAIPKTKGARVRQGGVTYEFDGRQWNPVQ